MKSLMLSAAIAFAAGTAFAGGLGEPVMETEVVAERASSSAGIIVPLLLLILIAAALSGGGGDGGPMIQPDT